MTARHSERYETPSGWAWENAEDRNLDDPSLDYEILRDTVIAAFNPSDDDVAEPYLMTEALDRAWAFIVDQPCHCPPAHVTHGDTTVTNWFGLWCARCEALGRSNDERIER